MSEFAYPLDGEQNYVASQCGAFFAGRSSGVFSAEDNLRVSITGARQLTLSSGIAWITTDRFWGKVYCNTDAINFVLPTADGVLDMICRVVIRWNKTTNICQALLLEGSPASTPVAPARNTSDELFDLVIADYLVEHGETEASASRLTDQRLNESLCGLMRDNVTRIPTEQLQAQVESLIEDLRQAYEDAGELTIPDHAYTHSTDGDDPISPESIGAVPSTRTINGKSLSSDISLTASDVSAVPTSQKGSANGVATLDGNGKVVAEQASAAVVTHNQATSYTLSAADMGKFHRFMIADGTTATCNVTLPDDDGAIPVGSELEIMKMNGGLTLNIKCATNVYIYTKDKWNNSTLTLDGSYGLISLKKMAERRWVARGDIA